MYVFYIDGEILYYPGDSECMIMDPEINLALNEAGSCEFKLPVENPYYNELHLRQTMIKVERDGDEVFSGEVRECPKDGDRLRKVYVVGELAFLHNSRQPQHVYGEITPYAFLNAILQIHNAQTEARQHFTIGTVTVSNGFNPIYFTTDHNDTLDVIRTMLLDNLGGVLRIRKQNGTRYLDYITIAEYGNYNTQGITFGENLMDYAEDYSANNVVTAVIPRGAVIEGADSEFQRHVDITSVTPNGEDYLINQSAANSYGYIWKVVDFPGIDDPQDLYDAADQWLTDNQYDDLELTLTAADQSALDADITAFKLGDRVPVYAEPYGMNKTFPVKTQTLYPQAPENERLKLSANLRRKSTYTSYAAALATVTSAAEKQERLTIQKLIMQELSNVVAQFTGSSGGYKLSEYDNNGSWLRDLYMDNPNKMQATNIMQISMAGIAFSQNGYNGPYTSAWQLNGTFNADRILTGTLLASLIKAGILSDVDGNFSLNLETGAISAKNMSIDSTNFDLDTAGNMTATSATLNNASINGGHIVSSSATETLDIEQALIKGKRGNSEIGYIDLSADTGDQQQTEYNAVMGSNNTLRLEFFTEIQLVDRRNDQMVGYIDGNGYHGPIDDSWLPEPTVIYIYENGNGNGNGSGNNEG